MRGLFFMEKLRKTELYRQLFHKLKEKHRQKEVENMEIIFGMTGTLFLGLMFLAAGKFFFEKEKKLKITGIKTTAKITEKKSGYRKSLLLTVEYAADNKLIKKKITTSRFLFSLEKGDEVTIFYNKNKPENFCFENDKRYIMRSGLFFFAGLMEILASIAAFFTWILK